MIRIRSTCCAVLAGLTMTGAAVGTAAVAAAGASERLAAPVHVRIIPLTPGCGPGSVAVDRHKRAVWVNCVARISEATQRITKRFPFAAQGVAVDPELGVAWAADNGHGTLTEIGEGHNKVLHRITGLTDPNTVAVDTRTRTVWVTSDPFVKVYSEVTHRLLHTIRLGLNKFEIPWDLTVDPRAGKVWVAVIPSSDHLTRTWVAEISATKYKVIHTYPYAGGTAITAADPARGMVWMEIGDSRNPATIKVIKESTDHVVRTLRNMPVAPSGLVVNSRTRTVLATGIGNHFQAISEASGKIIRTIRIRAPSDVAVDQGTGNIYVTVLSIGHPAVAQFRL